MNLKPIDSLPTSARFCILKNTPIVGFVVEIEASETNRRAIFSTPLSLVSLFNHNFLRSYWWITGGLLAAYAELTSWLLIVYF